VWSGIRWPKTDKKISLFRQKQRVLFNTVTRFFEFLMIAIFNLTMKHGIRGLSFTLLSFSFSLFEIEQFFWQCLCNFKNFDLVGFCIISVCIFWEWVDWKWIERSLECVKQIGSKILFTTEWTGIVRSLILHLLNNFEHSTVISLHQTSHVMWQASFKPVTCVWYHSLSQCHIISHTLSHTITHSIFFFYFEIFEFLIHFFALSIIFDDWRHWDLRFDKHENVGLICSTGWTCWTCTNHILFIQASNGPFCFFLCKNLTSNFIFFNLLFSWMRMTDNSMNSMQKLFSVFNLQPATKSRIPLWSIDETHSLLN
jgi:hypothetical protein